MMVISPIPTVIHYEFRNTINLRPIKPGMDKYRLGPLRIQCLEIHHNLHARNLVLNSSAYHFSTNTKLTPIHYYFKQNFLSPTMVDFGILAYVPWIINPFVGSSIGVLGSLGSHN